MTIIRDATDNSPDDGGPKSHRSDVLRRRQRPRGVCPTDDSYVPVPVFIAVVLGVHQMGQHFVIATMHRSKTAGG